MSKQQFLDKTIRHLGETWKVIGVGAQQDGRTYCHLANTIRYRAQKNGMLPVQIGDWIDNKVLKAA